MEGVADHTQIQVGNSETCSPWGWGWGWEGTQPQGRGEGRELGGGVAQRQGSQSFPRTTTQMPREKG